MVRVVGEFGTGRVRTTVLHTGGDRYVWIRRPGPDRAVPAPVPAGDRPVRLVLPEPPRRWAGVGATAYVTGGPRSLAALLLGGGRDADIAGVLRESGARLADLHRLPAPSFEPGGLGRLARALRSRGGPRAAARLHDQVRVCFGPTRMSMVDGWLRGAGAGAGAGAGRVLLHGAPTIGAIVPDREGAGGCLLTGEDLGGGPVELDLGWLIGDLVELRSAAAQAGATTHDRLIGAVLDGYGPGHDTDAVGRYAALRVLAHLSDYASYVGWRATMPAAVKVAAAIVDSAAAATLLPARTGRDR